MGKFKQVFRKLRDPRADNSTHELVEVLFIALLAVLCGAEGPTDMERFGEAKEYLLREFLPLEAGIPSHDTFGRIFQVLVPEEFELVFGKFVRAFARFNRLDLKGVIAIDGKALRGAYERGKAATPMQLVSAFAAEARMALASRKAPRRNEVEAALDILRMLRLKHSFVTGDALFCSRSIAATVLERGGDYVLALKGNQSKLFAAVERRFARKGPRSSAELFEPSIHDRRERRRATIIRDKSLGLEQSFPGVTALGRVTSRRRLRGGKAQKPLVRYFLLSTYVSAKELLRIVRSHWSIENQLHWLLDVVFKEDASRCRKDHGPENFAIIRKMALNVLRAHPAKMSMRGKVKIAGWNDAFLLDLIGHIGHMR